MIDVKVSTLIPEWPLIRQTPGLKGIWGNCQFFVNQDIEECDYWVVYEGLLNPERTLCPAENTILITGEPPTIKNYSGHFLKQFASIITCHRNIRHPNVIYTQQALPWMVGARYLRKERKWDTAFTKDYDELKELTYINKDKLMSVICTTKTITDGQRRRLEFVKMLSSSLKCDIDVFIPGEQDLEDKWDAIARYKYHISLENSSFTDYWTEKLSDAFLGLAYPFYYGCPNLADYFPKEAFTTIPINDVKKAVRLIEEAIENDYYQKSLESLRIAKDLVLDKYNLFAMLAELCCKQQSSDTRRHLVLRPEHTWGKTSTGSTQLLGKGLSLLRQRSISALRRLWSGI